MILSQMGIFVKQKRLGFQVFRRKEKGGHEAALEKKNV